MADFYFMHITAEVSFRRQVHSLFGVVASFTGTYKADQWSLTLSSQGKNSLVKLSNI